MDTTLVVLTVLITFGELAVRRILFALKTILKSASR
jgi:hypothetical protein